MKNYIILAIATGLLAACDSRTVVQAPADQSTPAPAAAPAEKVIEKNTTVVNPPAVVEEKKVENKTTVVNPPARPGDDDKKKHEDDKHDDKQQDRPVSPP